MADKKLRSARYEYAAYAQQQGPHGHNRVIRDLLLTEEPVRFLVLVQDQSTPIAIQAMVDVQST